MKFFHPASRPVRLTLLAGIVALCALMALGQERRTSNPYSVIAGDLHAFPAYIQWPTNSVATQQPWRIGIWGTDPFGDLMEHTVKDRPVVSRDFQIIRSGKINDLTNCDLVYFTVKDEQRIGPALTALAGHPVLTVGEGEDFLKLGGMVRMEVSKTVRFQINLDHTRAAGLKVRAEMLEIASEVWEDGRLKKTK
jgi:hypothetical protein